MTFADWQLLDSLLAKLDVDEKRGLIERLSQSLCDSTPTVSSIAAQRNALERALSAMSGLSEPDCSGGFSGRDHDQALYGASS